MRSVRVAYTPTDGAPATLMPHLPLTLHFGGRSVAVTGLLDTGSAVNVLPYPIGLALGAVWEEQTLRVPLVGSLGRLEARALVVFASHPQITPAAIHWQKTAPLATPGQRRPPAPG